MGVAGNRSGYGMTSGKQDNVNASGAGVVVVAGKEGKRHSIATLVISASAACTVQINDEEGHNVFPTMFFPANGGIVSGEFTANSYLSDHENKGLVAVCSVANPISVAMETYLVPAQKSS